MAIALKVEQNDVSETTGSINVSVVVMSNMLEEENIHSIVVNVSTSPGSAQSKYQHAGNKAFLLWVTSIYGECCRSGWNFQFM